MPALTRFKATFLTPRALRLGTASLLILATGAVLLPRVTSYISTSAVVNAPMITVTSPFNGRVVEAPAMAGIIRAGQPIAEIEPSFEQRQKLVELSAERDARASQLVAIDTQIAELRGLLSAEKARLANREALIARRQEARLSGARATIAQAEARKHEVEIRFGRTSKLKTKGAVAAANVDLDQRDLTVSEQDIVREEARLDELKIDQEAIAGGLITDNDDGDHEARIHETTLKLADLATERARIESEKVAYETRIAGLETDRFAPIASGNAVVQSLNARAGDDVNDGDQLMRLVDCDRRFLEVAVSERLFESIAPGSKATVQLRGSNQPFEARVTAVRGAGARLDSPDLAAQPPQVPEGQLRVLVALDPADLSDPATSASFCDVGRTAEVRFDRSLFADLRLLGFGSRPKAPAAAPAPATTAAAHAAALVTADTAEAPRD